MIGKLFSGKPSAAAATPEGERLYAVGDIHGCAALLDVLLEKINADDAADGKKRRLIFLGDYVDRGGDSKGVIDRLMAIRAREPETIFLKGNHEQAVLDFLDDPNLNEDWLHWGGDKTLESYGIGGIWQKSPGALAEALAGLGDPRAARAGGAPRLHDLLCGGDRPARRSHDRRRRPDPVGRRPDR